MALPEELQQIVDAIASNMIVSKTGDPLSDTELEKSLKSVLFFSTAALSTVEARGFKTTLSAENKVANENRKKNGTVELNPGDPGYIVEGSMKSSVVTGGKTIPLEQIFRAIKVEKSAVTEYEKKLATLEILKKQRDDGETDAAGNRDATITDLEKDIAQFQSNIINTFKSFFQATIETKQIQPTKPGGKVTEKKVYTLAAVSEDKEEELSKNAGLLSKDEIEEISTTYYHRSVAIKSTMQSWPYATSEDEDKTLKKIKYLAKILAGEKARLEDEFSEIDTNAKDKTTEQKRQKLANDRAGVINLQEAISRRLERINRAKKTPAEFNEAEENFLEEQNSKDQLVLAINAVAAKGKTPGSEIDYIKLIDFAVKKFGDSPSDDEKIRLKELTGATKDFFLKFKNAEKRQAVTGINITTATNAGTTQPSQDVVSGINNILGDNLRKADAASAGTTDEDRIPYLFRAKKLLVEFSKNKSTPYFQENFRSQRKLTTTYNTQTLYQQRQDLIEQFGNIRGETRFLLSTVELAFNELATSDNLLQDDRDRLLGIITACYDSSGSIDIKKAGERALEIKPEKRLGAIGAQYQSAITISTSTNSLTDEIRHISDKNSEIQKLTGDRNREALKALISIGFPFAEFGNSDFVGSKKTDLIRKLELLNTALKGAARKNGDADKVETWLASAKEKIADKTLTRDWLIEEIARSLLDCYKTNKFEVCIESMKKAEMFKILGIDNAFLSDPDVKKELASYLEDPELAAKKEAQTERIKAFRVNFDNFKNQVDQLSILEEVRSPQRMYESEKMEIYQQLEEPTAAAELNNFFSADNVQQIAQNIDDGLSPQTSQAAQEFTEKAAAPKKEFNELNAELIRLNEDTKAIREQVKKEIESLFDHEEESKRLLDYASANHDFKDRLKILMGEVLVDRSKARTEAEASKTLQVLEIILQQTKRKEPATFTYVENENSITVTANGNSTQIVNHWLAVKEIIDEQRILDEKRIAANEAKSRNGLVIDTDNLAFTPISPSSPSSPGGGISEDTYHASLMVYSAKDKVQKTINDQLLAISTYIARHEHAATRPDDYQESINFKNALEALLLEVSKSELNPEIINNDGSLSLSCNQELSSFGNLTAEAHGSLAEIRNQQIQLEQAKFALEECRKLDQNPTLSAQLQALEEKIEAIEAEKAVKQKQIDDLQLLSSQSTKASEEQVRILTGQLEEVRKISGDTSELTFKLKEAELNLEVTKLESDLRQSRILALQQEQRSLNERINQIVSETFNGEEEPTNDEALNQAIIQTKQLFISLVNSEDPKLESINEAISTYLGLATMFDEELGETLDEEAQEKLEEDIELLTTLTKTYESYSNGTLNKDQYVTALRDNADKVTGAIDLILRLDQQVLESDEREEAALRIQRLAKKYIIRKDLPPKEKNEEEEEEEEEEVVVVGKGLKAEFLRDVKLLIQHSKIETNESQELAKSYAEDISGSIIGYLISEIEELATKATEEDSERIRDALDKLRPLGEFDSTNTRPSDYADLFTEEAKPQVLESIDLMYELQEKARQQEDKKKQEDLASAAILIQRAWRAHNDPDPYRKIFLAHKEQAEALRRKIEDLKKDQQDKPDYIDKGADISPLNSPPHTPRGVADLHDSIFPPTPPPIKKPDPSYTVTQCLQHAIEMLGTQDRLDLSRNDFKFRKLGKGETVNSPIVLEAEHIKILAGLDSSRLGNSRFGGLTFDFGKADPKDAQKFLSNLPEASLRDCVIKDLDLAKVVNGLDPAESKKILDNLKAARLINSKFDMDYKSIPELRREQDEGIVSSNISSPGKSPSISHVSTLKEQIYRTRF